MLCILLGICSHDDDDDDEGLGRSLPALAPPPALATTAV